MEPRVPAGRSYTLIRMRGTQRIAAGAQVRDACEALDRLTAWARQLPDEIGVVSDVEDVPAERLVLEWRTGGQIAKTLARPDRQASIRSPGATGCLRPPSPSRHGRRDAGVRPRGEHSARRGEAQRLLRFPSAFPGPCSRRFRRRDTRPGG